jgi:hypothetical protein
MAAMPPEQLDLAEAHPAILKALVESLKPVEKSEKEDTAAKVPIGPRLDGTPHLPKIADNHYRILSSDSSLHDIPKHMISRAQAIDPNLHIVNPD